MFEAMAPLHIGVVATALALAACAGNPMPPSSRADAPGIATDAGFGRFTDIPVPKGAEMDADRSLVLGAREAWVGRLVMKVSDRTGAMYDFYARQMPGFGWQPITSVRSEVSVLTFTRGDRVATVQLLSRTLFGSEVRLTVSPRGEPVPGDVPGAGTSAAPGLRADERIQATPLR